MSKTIRFGIIGCGEVGQSLGGEDVYSGIGEVHAGYITEIAGAELVAVADIKQENARALAEKFGLKDYYLDYHDLLAREDIDVVNICTPSGTHGAIAIDAAQAGKHVVVEKPMEVTLDKADAIIDACGKAGVKLQVVFPHRFGKGMQKVKASIERGVFGKIVLANAMCRRYRTQDYYSESTWRGTWAMDGGGALMNQGTHIIDAFLYLMGPARSVCGRMGTLGHSDVEVEDVAAAVVEFQSGAIGVIEATTCAYPDFGDRIDLHGEKGSVVLEGLPPQIVSWDISGEEQAIDLKEFEEDARPYFTHKAVFQDMVDALNEDREPLLSGQEGKRAIEVIQAIYQSAREQGRNTALR